MDPLIHIGSHGGRSQSHLTQGKGEVHLIILHTVTINSTLGLWEGVGETGGVHTDTRRTNKLQREMPQAQESNPEFTHCEAAAAPRCCLRVNQMDTVNTEEGTVSKHRTIRLFLSLCVSSCGGSCVSGAD